MTTTNSIVTIHMAASLDGFIARADGRVDWMETTDTFAGGETLTPEAAAAFLKSVGCYVMGSRTYETALKFEAGGFGWVYGDTPVFVLTTRTLPRRETVAFHSGSLAPFLENLRSRFQSIWVVGGGEVAGNCIRLSLADEVRYTILPVLIGDGVRFFDRVAKDVLLHLVESKTYDNGTVALRYQIKRPQP